GRPRAVDVNPDRIRSSWSLVRDRLCGDAGRPHRFLAVIDPATADPGAMERDPHPGLAVGISGILDSWRLSASTVEACAVDRSAGGRIRLARGPLLDPPLWWVHGRGMGRRWRPHGRALRRLH